MTLLFAHWTVFILCQSRCQMLSLSSLGGIIE